MLHFDRSHSFLLLFRCNHADLAITLSLMGVLASAG